MKVKLHVVYGHRRALRLKNDVLDYEQYCKNIHKRLDLLSVLGGEIDNNIGYNTDADTVRDAVGKRHKKECKECGNSLGSIFKIDTGDSTHHKESDKDKRGCGCKAGDRNEER
jgi:hypothetical protein